MSSRLSAIDPGEYVAQGEAIYANLKSALEKTHLGRIVAIDIESGDYFLGQTVVEAVQKAREKYPDRVFHTIRIGAKAVHSRR
jgi:hypothetical protein